MGLRASLSSESYSAEPGTAAVVAVNVTNDGSALMRTEIQLEGVDPEWVALPVPVIEVPAGETVTERAFLKPPREPESLAGSYPFSLTVKCLETGDERSLPSVLEVLSFHNVSIDIQPRRALLSSLASETDFQATVMNLSNVEHTLRLFATDHGENFTFSFDNEQVTVGPGVQKTVRVTATASKRALIANARLQQFTVACRSTDNKTVASSTHGQIEQRALITPGLSALIALVVLMIASSIVFWPRPPSIDTFIVPPEPILTGKDVTVHWSTSHAKSVTLVVDGRRFEDLLPNGSRTVTMSHAGDIKFDVIAVSGHRTSGNKERIVQVRDPIVPPEPQILSFDIEPKIVTVGQVIQVTYKLSESVTDAVLSPTGLKLDLKADGTQLEAQFTGIQTYRLIARNSAGQSTEKSVVVQVVQGSKASIIVFRAEQAVVDPLTKIVTLTWQVSGSQRRELIYDGREQLLDEESGQRDFPVRGDTTFILRVWDSDGNTTERQVSVKMGPEDGFTGGTFSRINQ
ncbi:MAG TPA: hypothetical protein VNI20_13680 [Fimbriimonadaceae bacterium]|nr:hypothetical protein [Fimbriimonadaceae bacterium]